MIPGKTVFILRWGPDGILIAAVILHNIMAHYQLILLNNMLWMIWKFAVDNIYEKIINQINLYILLSSFFETLSLSVTQTEAWLPLMTTLLGPFHKQFLSSWSKSCEKLITLICGLIIISAHNFFYKLWHICNHDIGKIITSWLGNNFSNFSKNAFS